MRQVRRLCAVLVLVAIAVATLPDAAGADEGTGECVQVVHDTYIAFYDPAVDAPVLVDDDTGTVVGNPDAYTMGDANSAGLYGNTSNPKSDGQPGVIPSISPGPQTIGGAFFSKGDLNKTIGSGGQLCSDLP